MTPWPKDPIRYEEMRKEKSELYKERFKNKENHPRYGKHIIIKPHRRIEIWFSKLEQRIPRETMRRMWLSEHNKGKNNPFFGKHPSDEVRRKNGEAHRGHKMSEYTKNAILKAMKEKRNTWKIPLKDTKPERMMQIALSLHGIKFEKHKAIIGQPDIFIEPNVCVFVDGDYWHANPEKYNSEKMIIKRPKIKLAKDVWAKDISINHQLTIEGYNVIRIWESDIIRNVENCAENIINLIQQIKSISQ